MVESADLLFELGTEELPPTALKTLSESLTTEFVTGLEKAGLAHGAVQSFATPRRLALIVKECATRQPDREIERRGPALQAAFDTHGNPTKAAAGFAHSCGTSVDRLGRLVTEKGEWLVHRIQEQGKAADQLLPSIAEHALNRLPIPKRMHWGNSEAQFVRPVHWLLFIHGDRVVPCTILDATAGNHTYGHRFHYPLAIEIGGADDYSRRLENPGHVIANFFTRKEQIRSQVKNTADALGAIAPIDPELLDEVTALVEWPSPIVAGFEEKYLAVPPEALILSMKKHQKYFHLVDGEGMLINHFITIANLDSPTPEVIKEGNERVIRPRLSDAMFFWEQDGKQSLEDRLESLKGVVFQAKLGTLHDKSVRVAKLAAWIAQHIGGDEQLSYRAGLLSRCDLMTSMVGEFPDMQGVMGRYQAGRDGENKELAQAMDEFYMPRFSGDRLPQSPTGISVSLAERIDTLVGIFGINQRPTGDKDPFALRRAALGALRILKEHALPIDLRELLTTAVTNLGERIPTDNLVRDVYDFALERLKGIYQEQGIPVDVFEAVATVKPKSIVDFDRRINAVIAFKALPDATALAAANKRIRNILKKTVTDSEAVDSGLFESAEEETLHQQVLIKEAEIEPFLKTYQYEKTLVSLAALRESVDRFFDQVMVMAENEAVRSNRLALLGKLNRLFLRVADISRI
ncbi:MAG: glycine--tRNA ligase subunit beta [Gammaproteobacteria bacterium]|nr:glycine--tRNA ligase subunit beta [Gammaproteobacteria bacterium]